jgi:hypothetical protein
LRAVSFFLWQRDWIGGLPYSGRGYSGFASDGFRYNVGTSPGQVESRPAREMNEIFGSALARERRGQGILRRDLRHEV